MPAPQPLDYDGAAKGATPQVGTGRARSAPPSLNNVSQPQPQPQPQTAPPEPAPGAKAPDAGDASSQDAASRTRKKPAGLAAANRKKSALPKAAAISDAARPVKPTRVPSSRGPIVPASGIQPSRDQPGDSSGDRSNDQGRPGLIGPS
jgi:hypothetical protein